VITSYFIFVQKRWFLPSPSVIRAPGAASTSWFHAAKALAMFVTAGSISTTSRCSTGWQLSAPNVTPAPRPMLTTRFGSGWNSIGRCPIIRCSIMLRDVVSASTLPSLEK